MALKDAKISNGELVTYTALIVHGNGFDVRQLSSQNSPEKEC